MLDTLAAPMGFYRKVKGEWVDGGRVELADLKAENGSRGFVEITLDVTFLDVVSLNESGRIPFGESTASMMRKGLTSYELSLLAKCESCEGYGGHLVLCPKIPQPDSKDQPGWWWATDWAINKRVWLRLEDEGKDFEAECLIRSRSPLRFKRGEDTPTVETRLDLGFAVLQCSMGHTEPVVAGAEPAVI